MKNDSATTKLVTLAELFAGFGSGRKLVADGEFTSDVPGAAVIFATIVKTAVPELGWTVLILPVTVPFDPTAGPVQVPDIKLLICCV